MYQNSNSEKKNSTLLCICLCVMNVHVFAHMSKTEADVIYLPESLSALHTEAGSPT